MKKIVFIIFFLFLATTCFATNQNCVDFANYRNNPFQFPYPEYYMKAKIIKVNSQKPNLNDSNQKIDFFGLSAVISKKWIKDNANSGGFITYRVDKKKLFIINTDTESLMGCTSLESRDANQDFCSAFKSTQEYYDKVWMLTPDDLKKKEYATQGNNWMVHHKGTWFADPRPVSAIYKYQGDKFVAYRRDFKRNNDVNLKSDIVIFPQKIAPNYVSIGISSSVENYEELLNEILTTLE